MRPETKRAPNDPSKPESAAAVFPDATGVGAGPASSPAGLVRRGISLGCCTRRPSRAEEERPPRTRPRPMPGGWTAALTGSGGPRERRRSRSAGGLARDEAPQAAAPAARFAGRIKLRRSSSPTAGPFRLPVLLSCTAGLICLLIGPLQQVCAAEPPAEDVLLQALSDELKRSLSLQLEDLDKPYFIQFSVEDSVTYRIVATYGALVSSDCDRTRTLQSLVRVGSPALDNSNFTGRGGFGARRGLMATAELPTDDDYRALRHAIWLAVDAQYKDAVETLTQKRAYLRDRTIEDRPPDFTPAEAITALDLRAFLPDCVPSSEAVAVEAKPGRGKAAEEHKESKPASDPAPAESAGAASPHSAAPDHVPTPAPPASPRAATSASPAHHGPDCLRFYSATTPPGAPARSRAAGSHARNTRPQTPPAARAGKRNRASL